MNNRRFAIPMAVGLGMSLSGCDALEEKGGPNEDIIGDWSVFSADGDEWPYTASDGTEVSGEMSVTTKLKAALTFTSPYGTETYEGDVEVIDKNVSYEIPFPTMDDVYQCDLVNDDTLSCDDEGGTVWKFERY